MSDSEIIDTGTVTVAPRQARLTASASVRDIWDALVELITNAHDSYGNLGEATQLKIEAYHGRGKNRWIRVSDRAEGMGPNELVEKITQSGERHAAEGARGFMGRGAKDITTLGRTVFETIQDGTYSMLELRPNLEYTRFKPRDATKADEERLGVRRNGTTVTLWLRDGVSLPRHDTLRERLPRHFALRDIFDASNSNKIVLVDVTNEPHTTDKLTYSPPRAERVFEETIEVDPEDYPGVTARLVVNRTEDRMQVPSYGSAFDQAGFLIVDGRAIHDLTFFRSNIEEEPLARYYYGRLECPHIGKLCDNFDRAQERDEVSDTNPVFIIDPDRNEGLARGHPFTQSLFARPAEVLEELIARHKQEVREEQQRIESEQLRRRFSELARLTSDFIREELHESPWGEEEVDPRPPAAPPLEFELVPYGFSMEVGTRKTLTLRAPREDSRSGPIEAKLVVDEAAVELASEHAVLEWDDDRGYFHTTIQLLANSVCDAFVVEASTTEGHSAEALGSVKPPREERMESPLEFARDSVVLKLNSPKRLLVLARQELVDRTGTRVHVGIQSDDFQVRGQFVELDKTTAGHYRGWVKVVGLRSGAEGRLWAKLGSQEATCEVAVRDRELPPKGGVSIRLVDKDLGIFRSRFSRDNPNVLEVSARHPCVSRYLEKDEAGNVNAGQDTAHFRLLMAEIVGESVARRIMISDDEDEGAGLLTRYRDTGQFLYAHQEKFQEFVTRAHRIMLSESEVRSLLEEAIS